MQNFTISNYSEILKLENLLIESISKKQMSIDDKKVLEPKKSSLNNILSYSKALSVRKSVIVGDMMFLLN